MNVLEEQTTVTLMLTVLTLKEAIPVLAIWVMKGMEQTAVVSSTDSFCCMSLLPR